MTAVKRHKNNHVCPIVTKACKKSFKAMSTPDLEEKTLVPCAKRGKMRASQTTVVLLIG